MSDIMEKLKRCKKNLEDAEREKVVIETKISGYMEQLNELGYKDEKSAVRALQQMSTDCSKLEDQLEGMIYEFQNKYSAILE